MVLISLSGEWFVLVSPAAGVLSLNTGHLDDVSLGLCVSYSSVSFDAGGDSHHRRTVRDV